VADDAGALLVRSGLIRSDDLAAARIACADVGGTIGEHLVAAGLVADELLTEFYRSRLLVPQVNPNNLARLASALVAVIPADMAVELRVVPVAVDREGNLTVAMSDPSDRHAVDEISFFTGKYVVRAVATQMQIAWCLAHYYGHVTELGRRLLRPSRTGGAAADTPPTPTPVAAVPAAMPRGRGDTGRVDALRKKVLPPTTPATQAPVNGDAVQAIRREDSGIPSTGGRVAAISRPTGHGSPTLVGVAPGPILAGAAVAIAPALDEAEPAPAAADSAVPTPAIDRDGDEPEDDAAWEAALARARAATADEVSADGDADGDDDGGDDRDGDAEWEAALARARAATAEEDLIDEDPAHGDGDEGSDRSAVPHRDDAAGEDDDDDEPEIQIRDVSGPVGAAVHADTQPTGPTINRLRTEDELADRHGEVEVRLPHQPRDLDLPAVVVAELAAPPVVIEADGRTSVPTAIARPGSEQEGHASADDERTLDLVDDEPLDDDEPHDDDDGVDEAIDDGPSQPILLLQHRRPETVDVAIPDGPGPHDDDDDDPDVTDNDGSSVTVSAAVAVIAPSPAARRSDDDAVDDDDDDEAARAAAEFDEGVTPPPATVDIVLLDRKKPETPPIGRRPERLTQVGVGSVGARRRRHSMRPDQGITQPMVDALLTAPPEIPALVDTTVRVPVDFAPDHAAPPVPDLVRRPPWTAADSPPARPHPVIDTPTLKTAGTPSHGDPPSGPSGRVAAPQSAASSDQVVDGVPRFVQDDENSNTRRLESARNRRASKSMSEIDDDWGPPGSTIPPPFLGVMAGVDDDAPAGRIPILADDDLSGPLLVAPPSPPEDRPRRTPVPSDAVPVAASPGASASPLPASLSRPHPIELARDLEAASTRLVDLLRDLDRAHSRDGVIEVLVGLLADSHTQAAFFAVRGGELHPFATRPAAPGAGSAALRLDAASTFQDVVGTRLPYRGPLVDDASRALVINTFGSQPDEVLVMPVAVRDRVVGVLYGAGRLRHTFDEHLALAARAAGLAFERILKSKRTPVP
jgi:hypothetical protein